MDKQPTLLTSIVIPAIAALVTGTLAGAFAFAIGLPYLPIGLGVCLVTWIFRDGIVSSLPIDLPPENKELTVRVNVINQDSKWGDFLQLPIDQERLKKFAIGMTEGRDLSTRTWTGPGAIFSQSEFVHLRSELMIRGLARWVSDRDSRSGAILTAKGKAVMRGLATTSEKQVYPLESSKKGSTMHPHTPTEAPRGKTISHLG